MRRLPFLSSLFALNKNHFRPMTHHGLVLGKTGATAISNDAAVVKEISGKVHTTTKEIAKEKAIKPSSAWSCSAKVLTDGKVLLSPATTVTRNIEIK